MPLSRRSYLSYIAAASGQVAGIWAGLNVQRAFAASERILAHVKSAYNELVVGEQGSIRTLYFVVDGRRYIESRWDMSVPLSLDLDYSRTMMAGFLVAPEVRKIAMIGLGGGQLTNYLFARLADVEIDAVDIDPEVVRLARQYFGIPDSPRYRTHAGDGRIWLEQSRENYDLLLLDAFHGVSVPYHLKTAEFYTACARRLGPNGVVVANLHNRVKMYSHDRQTLASVFHRNYSFASESGSQTTYVGSQSTKEVGTFEMRKNAANFAKLADFDVHALAARRYYHVDWDVGATVLHDDFSPENLLEAVHTYNVACFENCRYTDGR